MKVYLLMLGDRYEGYYVSAVYRKKEDAEKEKSLREKENKNYEEESGYNYYISEKELI